MQAKTNIEKVADKVAQMINVGRTKKLIKETEADMDMPPEKKQKVLQVLREILIEFKKPDNL